MNPKDVFPRRNLPGDAEEWGRIVERRIQAVESNTLIQQSGLRSENRSASSSLQELSRQLISLQNVVKSLPVTRQANTNVSGIGALSPGWNTIASATLSVPASMNRVRLLGVGSGQLVANTSGVVAMSTRLNLVGSSASPTQAGAWFAGSGDFRNVVVPEWSWNVAVTPGGSLTVEFQVAPDNAGSYTGSSASYATLSLLGTFTGQ